MTIAVTGGAGYIGAHVVSALEAAGRDVLVVDDFSTSTRERAAGRALVELDLAAPGAADALTAAFTDHGVDAVVHLAAKKQVGESVAEPVWYYQQNVGGLAAVLDASRVAGCRRLLFSSSAAVYGEPAGGAVDESVVPLPINPYGETKLVGEWLARDAGRAWGLEHVALRYFNVAGAGRPELGDPAVLNLVTMVLDRLEQGLAPVVFGTDYPTPDGTCVRDFVHVQDLAEAHVAALAALETGGLPSSTYDVGTGRGASVREVLAALADASGLDTTPETTGRRPGDPAVLVARAERIRAEIGWAPRFGLDDIAASAWAAWRAQRARGVEPVRAAR
ncbi:UDP-glucose 4-epimerase GalE [Cellulomonas alba]|uniref:UDP-glucose 4-epimerase n=1 Tax=Cellulomonas alba TaxID=3053467 RepID=A0ABT7SCW8_9CELL|nr:UDP-glucose 4-epimerase GalE [Cellulomonas alba]MDM7854038.1 UDP-glucose 4-epimerase GalE [Cellulomonas alba]